MAEVKAWVWSGNAAKLLADNILVGATTVSATELGYLSGVTSAIQTQLNGKEPTINLTINRAVISDGSGGLTVSATTATEVGYLSGVTSAIQTQIDSKTGIADNETITGTWIFNNLITGSISGNAGTVTNGAYVNSANTFTLAQTITAASNQIVLSSGVNQLTLNSGTSAAARTYTIPDVGTSADFVMTAGAQTIAGAKTFSGEISSDAGHLGGYGLLPVGAIVAYNPGYYTDGGNGGFATIGPAGNSVAQVNSFLNAKGWYVCDGAALNVADSPIWNAAGRYLPNLDDGRFLRGSTTAGTQGGAATTSIAHTHSVTSNVTVGNHTLTTANLPSHSHSINHGHTASSNTTGNHFHAYNIYGGGNSGHSAVPQPGAATPDTANNTAASIGTGTAGNHSHTITVNNHNGNSGNTGSGTAVTHSVTNNPVTSGAASVSSVSIEPTYLNTFFIVRVF